MKKYLYAAAVQGIQGFILSSNKLREIAGASELVESICTDFFQKQVANYDEQKSIVGAAGNIKYVFENEADCKKLMLNFPKLVAQYAPGIQLSQTVVVFEEGTSYKSIVDAAEEELRIQKNSPAQPELTWMAAQRVPKTGAAYVESDAGERKDLASVKKAEIADKGGDRLVGKIYPNLSSLGEIKPFAKELSDLPQEQEKSYIAVVHADGNNMGKLLMDMAESECEDYLLKANSMQDVFRDFSKLIEQATCAAAQEAFKKTYKDEIEAYEKPLDEYKKERDDILAAIQELRDTERKSEQDWKLIKDLEKKVAKLRRKSKKYKPLLFRPIILGGDDLSIICQADKAIAFTEVFLRKFEEETKNLFQEGLLEKYFDKEDELSFLSKGLTACAGIAFVKAKFPFHAALHLAEELCKHSKKKAKELVKDKYASVPSAISFYKQQSSFLSGSSFSEIFDEELALPTSLQQNADQKHFTACPYYIDEGNGFSLANLKSWSDALRKDKNASLKSRLRKLLTVAYDGDASAVDFERKRIEQLHEKDLKQVGVQDKNYQHLFDLLCYYDLAGKTSTKSEKTEVEL